MSDSINAIGFDLARQFRDPAFRDRVRAMGYTTEPMVPVLSDATLQSVLDRIGDSVGRYLLAIRDEQAPLGWRFAWWEEQR